MDSFLTTNIVWFLFLLFITCLVMPISYGVGVNSGSRVRDSMLEKQIEYREDYIKSLKTTVDELEKEVIAWQEFGMHTWDYELMARLIQAEVGDSSDFTKAKVASVILNRVKSDRFPDTVMDVMVAQNQFTPMSKGTAYEADAEETDYEAINRAVLADYSGGSLYFINPDLAHNVAWFTAMDEVSRSDGTAFFKPKE